MTDDRDKLITINEVAKLINIPRSQVLKHRTKLNLPAPVTVLNAYYYRVEDIEEWIARTDVKALLKSIYSEEYKNRVAKEQAAGKVKQQTLHWQGLCERFDIPLDLYTKFCTGRLYHEST